MNITKEFFLPPDNGDTCWEKGAISFSRKEVFALLHTQRAMIGNDLKTHCGRELTDEMFQIIDNPRIPKF